MAQNIFKNLGKSPSQIHWTALRKPNLYAQSLEETKSKGMYEKSVEALSRCKVTKIWHKYGIGF